MNTISELEEKCARYIVVCVSEFADAKNLDKPAAFRYLYNNKGIDFLMEHYEIEHTLSLRDAVEDLTLICRRNGGMI